MSVAGLAAELSEYEKQRLANIAKNMYSSFSLHRRSTSRHDTTTARLNSTMAESVRATRASDRAMLAKLGLQQERDALNHGASQRSNVQRRRAPLPKAVTMAGGRNSPRLSGRLPVAGVLEDDGDDAELRAGRRTTYPGA